MIWDHIHLMWLERNQDRHGREQKERAERARRRNLREIAVWHRGKPRGLLGMPGGEEPFFYSSYRRHLEKESSARAADMWLRTYRPVLVACKARAMEQRITARKYGSSNANAGIAEGHSSPGSAGDGEPAEPVLVGPDVELLGIIESIT